jgi:hypothetical protein
MRNAADPEQVKEAAIRERHGRELELEDLKGILATPQGRRFVWRLLEEARVFNSVWHNSALIHYNAGKQDFGHLILADVMEASSDALTLMMRENRRVKEKNGD